MHQYLLREIAVREHLSESDIELCIKCSEPFSVSKNTILEETGKIPRYLYYIVSGFMRLFYYDENGDEATMHIMRLPCILTALMAFLRLSLIFPIRLSPL